MEYIMRECRETKKDGKNLLYESGKHIAWMMDINSKRKKEFENRVNKSTEEQ